MSLKTLEDVLIDQLKDLKSAESQLVKALPKMAKHVSCENLKSELNAHLEQTKKQLERIDQMGEALGKKLTAKTCKGMEGLLIEGSEVASEDGDPSLVDLGIIAAAQRVEHYEIAAYGTACEIASRLGQDKVLSLLKETLDEEENADRKLTAAADKIYQSLQSGALSASKN